MNGCGRVGQATSHISTAAAAARTLSLPCMYVAFCCLRLSSHPHTHTHRQTTTTHIDGNGNLPTPLGRDEAVLQPQQSRGQLLRRQIGASGAQAHEPRVRAAAAAAAAAAAVTVVAATADELADFL